MLFWAALTLFLVWSGISWCNLDHRRLRLYLDMTWPLWVLALTLMLWSLPSRM